MYCGILWFLGDIVVLILTESLIYRQTEVKHEPNIWCFISLQAILLWHWLTSLVMLFFTSLIDACYEAVDTMWNIVRVFNCPHRFYFCSAFELALLVAAPNEHGTEGGSLLCHERKGPHLTLKFKSGHEVFYKVILFICLWIERMIFSFDCWEWKNFINLST